MDKINITQSGLNLKRIKNVLTTAIKKQANPIFVKGRHSDAFVFVTTGSCTYTFDNDYYSITASEGDILYLARNAVYTMHLNTDVYSSVYCDFEFDCDDIRESQVYTPQNVSHTENLFYKLKSCFEKPTKSSFAECMSLLYSIYAVVLKSVNPAYIEKTSKNKIEEAKLYIDKNFWDSSISVNLLAEKSGMSEVYFRKIFKLYYDISPSQYIISVRLKKAKLFMKYPFLNLEECAIRSGFSSLQYFCRVFKKETGITPTEYRNKK